MRALSIVLFAMTAQGPPPWTYPDRELTPGAVNHDVTRENLDVTICKSGWTKSVRNVTAAAKRRVLERYKTAHPDWPLDQPLEIDHLVSLELGGSNDESNLWPEPYCKVGAGDSCFGARQKDVVETTLKRWICSGKINLQAAHTIIVTDWLACYQTIKAGSICTVPQTQHGTFSVD